jgi:hypothetical protein
MYLLDIKSKQTASSQYQYQDSIRLGILNCMINFLLVVEPNQIRPHITLTTHKRKTLYQKLCLSKLILPSLV